MICRRDVAVVIDRCLLGLPAKLPPDNRGLFDALCSTNCVPEPRGERAGWIIFCPEERGEMVSTVTRPPVVVRRTSERERERGRERGGGMMGRPLVEEEEVVVELWVLWRGGVMTATAMREVGREVVMGRGGTRMSGSERVVKHMLILELIYIYYMGGFRKGMYIIKGRLSLMVMDCTCCV